VGPQTRQPAAGQPAAGQPAAGQPAARQPASSKGYSGKEVSAEVQQIFAKAVEQLMSEKRVGIDSNQQEDFKNAIMAIAKTYGNSLGDDKYERDQFISNIKNIQTGAQALCSALFASIKNQTKEEKAAFNKAFANLREVWPNAERLVKQAYSSSGGYRILRNLA
jgi:hypothetical protein